MNNAAHKRQRRFLVIADFQGYGGTRTYFFLLMDFLLRNDVLVSAFIFSWSAISPSERDDLKTRGVRLQIIPRSSHMKSRLAKMLRLDKAFQFLFFIRQNYAGYDKVIVSTGNPFQFFPGGLIFGSKFVYISHSYPTHKLSWFSRNIADVCNRLLYRLPRQRAKLIVVSEAAGNKVKKHLEAAGIVPGPDIEVVYNTSTVSNAGLVNKECDTVVTVGHVVDYKNPAFWIDVAMYVISRHQQARFVWIGDGTKTEDLKSGIPDEFRKKIIFTGHKEHAGEMVAGYEIYFQPSLIENHCISVLDAMAQAVPCVVSNRGGLPESVDHGITGYVVELVVEQAGERILHLLKNKSLARKMGEAGYEKFQASFSVPVWEKRMEEVLIGTGTDV